MHAQDLCRLHHGDGGDGGGALQNAPHLIILGQLLCAQILGLLLDQFGLTLQFMAVRPQLAPQGSPQAGPTHQPSGWPRWLRTHAEGAGWRAPLWGGLLRRPLASGVLELAGRWGRQAPLGTRRRSTSATSILTLSGVQRGGLLE